MERRKFLKAVSTSTVAGMAVLAGCSGGNNNGGDGGGGGGTSAGGGTATSGGAGGGGTTAGGGTGGTSTEMAGGTSTGTAGGTSTEMTGGTPAETAGGTSTGTTGGTSTEMAGGTTTGTAGGTSTGMNATTGGGGGGGTTTVGMYTEGSDYYFDPIGLLVEPGTTVTFAIESGSHSSTAYAEGNGPASVRRIPEGAEAWDSGTISGSSTFEHTFDTEGTYDYFCIPHKTLGMVGRIVVGSPGGPAEGSMPPDGEVPQSQTIVDQGSVSYSSFSG